MPAITSVTAALMVLFDAILGTFASAQSVNSPSACALNAVDVTLTSCGISFVDALTDLTHAVTQLASSLFVGLGVL